MPGLQIRTPSPIGAVGGGDRYPENPVLLNDNLGQDNAPVFFDRRALSRVLVSREDDVNNRQIEWVFLQYLQGHNITEALGAGIHRIGNGANGMVFRIAELDLALSLITHLVKDGMGVIFGFKSGTMSRISFNYTPGMSYASMHLILKQAMAEHAAKLVYKARSINDDAMLAVKIQLLTSSEAVEDVRHENVVHAELSSDPKLKSLVPAMYAAATIVVPVGSGENVGIRVTFMQFIAPTYKTLSEFMSEPAVKTDRTARVKLYTSLRDAFIDLWAAGYAHGDAHAKNIVINNRTKNICFYDFGMTVKLDPAVKSMCTNLQKSRDSQADAYTLHGLLDACTEAVHDNMVRVLKKRFPDFGFANLDPLMLKGIRVWVDEPARRPYSARVLSQREEQSLAPQRNAMDYRNQYVPVWYLNKEPTISTRAKRQSRTSVPKVTNNSNSNKSNGRETTRVTRPVRATRATRTRTVP